MTVRMARLNEICDINPKMPRSLDDGALASFLPMAAVSEEGHIAFEEERTVSEVKRGYTYFERGDVLVAKITPCFENGKASRTTSLSKPFGFGSTEFHVLRAANDAVPDYLFYKIWNSSFRELGAQNMTGSAGQKRVPADFLKRLEILLPPLDEQRRIAAILDKADALRRKRKRAFELLEDLVRSSFLEMFGDPVRNPKGWRERPLADFESFLTSGSRGWAKYYSQSGKAFIRIQNLQQGELSTSDVQYVNVPDSAESRRTTVRSGDVLISITADLGRTAVVPAALDSQAHINQHIALVRTTGINPAYLSMYLASRAGQLQFEALNRQGVKAGLNFDDIRSLKILEPPMALQEKYVELRAKIRKTSERFVGEALASHSLFTSLQHRAFSGQL